jgi:hypothetical protein
MEWWKRFPWRRLLALLVVAALVMLVAVSQVRGETRYVKVDSSSPDAVVQSSTDFFDAEAVGKLVTNQPVEMLDKTDGEYVMIRATVDGRKIEGWVKKIILQDKPLENQPRVTESGAVQSAAFAAPGFSEEIENDMKADSAQMREAMKRVDAFEASRNKSFGGNAKDPDPAKQREQVKNFGKDGKLIN